MTRWIVILSVVLAFFSGLGIAYFGVVLSLPPRQAFWERALADPVAVFTLALVAFTFVLAVSTLGLWVATWRLQKDSGRQLAVAEQAVSVAKLTLTGVERPILDLTVYAGPAALQFRPPGLIVDETRTGIAVITENVGKQIAIVNFILADYIIQSDSTPPALLGKSPTEMQPSFCLFNLLGELPIKPGLKGTLWGERHTTMSEEEIEQINRREKFAFFHINVVYADPVGVLRSAITTFWFSPSKQLFIRLQSMDRILEKATLTEQKEAQRKAHATTIRLNS